MMKMKQNNFAIDRIQLAGTLPDQIAKTLPKAIRTLEGFWRIWGYAARAGNVQEYPDLLGHGRLQYRPEAEVFSVASLESYRGRAVVLGHPACKMLLPAVIAQHSQGSVVEAVAVMNVAGVAGLNLVRVEMLITGALGVAEVESPTGLRELSAGYWRHLDPVADVSPAGESYTCIVRQIQINHLALEPEGRAGQEVRLRGATDNRPRGQETVMEFIEVKLPDGRVIRVATPDAGVFRAFTASTIDAANIATLAATDAADAVTKLETSLAECATLKADLAQFQADAAKVEVEGLREGVKDLLPGVGLDSLGAQGLKRAVVKAAYPELEPTFSDSAIDGVYSKALDKLKAARGIVQDQLAGTGGATDSTDDNSIAAIRAKTKKLEAENLQRQADAWRRPAQ